MRDFLRNPERNALILGLIQGIPQGLIFKDQKQFIGVGFDDADVILLLGFGLFGPPILALFNHFANGGKSSVWWDKVLEYVNLFHMVSWGALSFGLLGAYFLYSSGASEGYAVCAFFVGAAAGFAGANLLERWLKRRGNAI